MAIFDGYKFNQFKYFYEELQSSVKKSLSKLKQDSSYCFDLSADTGMDFIDNLEQDNALGRKLTGKLTALLKVMRMSQVMARSSMPIEEFDKNFKLAKYQNLPLKSRQTKAEVLFGQDACFWCSTVWLPMSGHAQKPTFIYS